ncbi:MAG: hypothetical protein NUV77_24595 [Thermoguttaceae bacterium]|nr:hypothetical protein [Thermoguttaceae bacterium]
MASQRPELVVYESTAAFDASRIQAAAVYCSDGRFGEPMDDFLHTSLQLPRYDRLALPGGAACLAGHFRGYRQRDALEEALRFLIAAHELRRIVLIAHSDCAYYTHWLGVSGPELEERQCDDLRSAAARIARVAPLLSIEGYFARRCGAGVRFERVPLSSP